MLYSCTHMATVGVKGLRADHTEVVSYRMKVQGKTSSVTLPPLNDKKPSCR